MKVVHTDQIHKSLQAIGIQPGDGLLVHTALQFLGKPQGGVQIYLDALLDLLGETGTIAVPTFNFAFAKGQVFEPATTPSVGMGSFSELVRIHPSARRTTHPMQSLAVMGRFQSELIAADTPCAFDDGSAFDKMLARDFKLLLLGASIQAASIVHYSEQRASVPYRYWKDFRGEIAGRGIQTYRMFVRDERYDAQLKLVPVETELRARRLWNDAPLNYGKISACRLRDFVAVADELLRADPWILVENKPQ
jgi:aminoglycoside N3'-acetyltransferase